VLYLTTNSHLPRLPSLHVLPPFALQESSLDPSFVITHRPPLDKAAEAYKMFNNKEDGCIKVGWGAQHWGGSGGEVGLAGGGGVGR